MTERRNSTLQLQEGRICSSGCSQSSTCQLVWNIRLLLIREVLQFGRPHVSLACPQLTFCPGIPQTGCTAGARTPGCWIPVPASREAECMDARRRAGAPSRRPWARSQRRGRYAATALLLPCPAPTMRGIRQYCLLRIAAEDMQSRQDVVRPPASRQVEFQERMLRHKGQTVTLTTRCHPPRPLDFFTTPAFPTSALFVRLFPLRVTVPSSFAM